RGLWVSRLFFNTFLEHPVSTPTLVLQRGQPVEGFTGALDQSLTGLVDGIGVYDPINDTGRGQLGLWISTDAGAQAIVRAAPACSPAPPRILNMNQAGESRDMKGCWGDKQLGPAVGKKVQKKGCALTSTAMALRHAGLLNPGTSPSLEIDPGNLNSYYTKL